MEIKDKIEAIRKELSYLVSYEGAVEILIHREKKEAQKEMYDNITQLLMNQGIIYRNGYGSLCSDIKSENIGDRMKAFAKQMNELQKTTHNETYKNSEGIPENVEIEPPVIFHKDSVEINGLKKREVKE